MNSEVWYEEELVPSEQSIAKLVEGSKGLGARRDLEATRGTVRVHHPRWAMMDPAGSSKIAVPSPGYRYCVVRLGCEFDPGETDRKKRREYVRARFQAFLYADVSPGPRVYSLAPKQINSGKPATMKVNFGPSLKTPDGVEASLGSLESDVTVGTVAAVMRGFAGANEQQPYWNLQRSPDAPLYGVRHFWLLVEAPQSLSQFYVKCFAEGEMQTIYGPLKVGPASKSTDTQQPRATVTLSGA